MKKSVPFHLCLSVFICGFLLFYRLGDRDLWASHEARAAQNAQRILDDGNWLTPRLFDDQVELQKPPMYYWLVAAAGWLRGGTVDAVAVRLPAALAGLATVLVVYSFHAGRGRPIAGLIAALVLASAQHFTWISRTGRIDVPLTFTVTVAILSLWAGRERETQAEQSFWWNLIGYFAIAAGVLLKGPIGAILPLAVVTVTGAVNRDRLFSRSLRWGLPLVIVVAGPWFVVAHLRTGGEFTRVFFWYHHVQRATGGATALAAHPWWFYGPRFAFDFLPWTPAVAATALFAFRTRNSDPIARLGIVWLTTILILLSLSRFKRADYLLPAYPGAAIWLGGVGERLYQGWRSLNRVRWASLGLGGSLATIIAMWLAYLIVAVPRMDAEHEQRSFAAEIRSIVPQPNLVLLFRVEDHLLSYHLGRPLNTSLEWENLDVWVSRPASHFVLMPAECAAQWHQYISSGTLETVLRYTDRTDRRHPRDIVLMRTHCRAEESNGPADRATADQQGADQRTAAGLQPVGGSGDDR
jgi:4-amino-4-deoxy-L-arabinose transferase-like glycosyltransferase